MALIWLTLRVRWRSAWPRSVAVVVLIGGIGGFILAAASSARSVESSYRVLTREIDAPDLVVLPPCDRVLGCGSPTDGSFDQAIAELESLPVVRRARLTRRVAPFFVDAVGVPLLSSDDDPNGCGGGDDRSAQILQLEPGGPTGQAMPFRLDGDMPAPGGTGAVVPLSMARRLGLERGDTLRLAGFCTDGGDPTQLAQAIDLTVTGLSTGPLDIDPSGSGFSVELMFVDKTVVGELAAAGAAVMADAVVWLDPAASLAALNAANESYDISIDLRQRAIAIDDTLETDARLLWLLAAVGAMGSLLLLAPIITRNVRATAIDRPTMVALGSSRQQVSLGTLAHVGVLAVAGVIVAMVAAPSIGLLMPRGFADCIAPNPAWTVDWMVTLVGGLALAFVVNVIGAVPALRAANDDRSVSRASRRRGAAIGFVQLRPAAHLGMLSAVGRRAGSRQTSPWPILLSLVIASATCVASVTFIAGLRHFEQAPALVGWNWDAQINFTDATTRPVPEIVDEISQIEGVDMVTAATPFYLTELLLSGTDLSVLPWSFDTGAGAITPSMLAGRAPIGVNEVAIDPAFAEIADLHIGDSVSLSRPALVSVLADEVANGASAEALSDYEFEQTDTAAVVSRFEITGVVVLPLGDSNQTPQVALTLGGLRTLVEASKAELAEALDWLPDDLPANLRAQAAEFVSQHAQLASFIADVRISGDMQATLDAIRSVEGVEDVYAPSAANVVRLLVGLNLASVDRIPTSLAYVVSIAAAALLMYLLVTAVRARRFEFAVLRVLGMSGIGVRWSIAVQATVTVLLPLIVALPLGVAIGRRAWLSYARNLDVVPISVTPWVVLALIVIVPVAIANLAVVVPAWGTARRSPGRDLRAG